MPMDMHFTAKLQQLGFRIRMNRCIRKCEQDDLVTCRQPLELVIGTQLVALFQRPGNTGGDAEDLHGIRMQNQEYSMILPTEIQGVFNANRLLSYLEAE